MDIPLDATYPAAPHVAAEDSATTYSRCCNSEHLPSPGEWNYFECSPQSCTSIQTSRRADLPAFHYGSTADDKMDSPTCTATSVSNKLTETPPSRLKKKPCVSLEPIHLAAPNSVASRRDPVAISPTRAARYPYWNTGPSFTMGWMNSYAQSPSIASPQFSATPFQAALRQESAIGSPSQSTISVPAFVHPSTRAQAERTFHLLAAPSQQFLVPTRQFPPLMVGDCIFDTPIAPSTPASRGELTGEGASSWNDRWNPFSPSSIVLHGEHIPPPPLATNASAMFSSNSNPLIAVSRLADSLTNYGDTSIGPTCRPSCGKAQPLHLLPTPHSSPDFIPVKGGALTEVLPVDVRGSGGRSEFDRNRILPSVQVVGPPPNLPNQLGDGVSPTSYLFSVDEDPISTEGPYCPVTEMVDWLDAARLFHSDVQNVGGALPACCTALRGQAVSTLAHLLRFMELLRPIVMDRAEDRTSREEDEAVRRQHTMQWEGVVHQVKHVLQFIEMARQGLHYRYTTALWATKAIDAALSDLSTGQHCLRRYNTMTRPCSPSSCSRGGGNGEERDVETAVHVECAAPQMSEEVLKEADASGDLCHLLDDVLPCSVDECQRKELEQVCLRIALAMKPQAHNEAPDAEMEHVLQLCVEHLFTHVRGFPEKRQVSLYPVFPSFSEVERSFSDMYLASSWKWWYEQQLRMMPMPTQSAATVAALEGCVETFLLTDRDGQKLLSVIEAGSNRQNGRDLLHRLDGEMRRVEGQYVEHGRTALQLMLRRIVVRSASSPATTSAEGVQSKCNTTELLYRGLALQHASVQFTTSKLEKRIRMADNELHTIRQIIRFTSSPADGAVRPATDVPVDASTRLHDTQPIGACKSFMEGTCRLATCYRCTAGNVSRRKEDRGSLVGNVFYQAAGVVQLLCSLIYFPSTEHDGVRGKKRDGEAVFSGETHLSARALQRLDQSLSDLTYSIGKNCTALQMI